MLLLRFAGGRPTIGSMSKKHKDLSRQLVLLAGVLVVQLVAGTIFWKWGANFTDSSASINHKLISYGCAFVMVLAPIIAFAINRRTADTGDITRISHSLWPIVLLVLLLAWPVAAYALNRDHFTSQSQQVVVVAEDGRVASAANKPKDNCISSVILLQRNAYQFSDYAHVISKYGSAADKAYLNKLPVTIDNLAEKCHQKKLSLKEETSQIKQLSQQFKTRGQSVLSSVPKDKLTDEEKALR